MYSERQEEQVRKERKGITQGIGEKESRTLNEIRVAVALVVQM